MVRLFILFFLLFSFVARGENVILKENLRRANPGSYLVLEQGKTFTFFHIFENNGEKIIIEEVSIPEKNMVAQHYQGGWKCWFEQGAPGHTSWTHSLVNLNNGRIEEMYSFTQKGWIDVSKTSSFMTTLLNLPFEQAPDKERRKIGLPPGYGKPDHRPLWHPRLIADGVLVQHVYFYVWKTRWPSDGSELARKIIEIYLPEANSSYPTYFPYLVEVEGKIGSAKVRVVDSGLIANSPKKRLPLRPPQLCGLPELKEDLFITLKSPCYFSEFVVFAEENNTFPPKQIPLPFTLTREGETVVICIDKSTLKSTLKQELNTPNGYHFIIMPKDNPTFCLETKECTFPQLM
jgi:hypothetical protein